MKATILTITVLLAISYACTSENKKEKKIEAQSETTVKETSEKKMIKAEEVLTPTTVNLKGKFLKEDDFGSSFYAVLLTVDGKTTAIDTVNACETIPASNFDQYDIPKTAKSACGGWWAGAGDYFYATIEKNKVVVYQGWQDETQTGNTYHWKAMKVKL